MNSLYQTLALAAKEWQVFMSDRGNLFTIFILPMLIATLLSSMYSQGGDLELPVIIVNEDSGQYSEDMLAILRDVEELDLQELSSVEEARTRVDASEAVAAILIPADFSQRIDAYEQTEVQVMLDPTQVQYGTIISSAMEEVIEAASIQGEMKYGMNAVMADMNLGGPEKQAADAQNDGVVNTQINRMLNDPPVAVVVEDLEGAELQAPDNMFLLFVPGFTVMFGFFLVQTLATQLLREKEVGSMRRLLAAPLPRTAIIGGKIIAYMLLLMLQIAIIFGISHFAFGMPLGNSPLGLLIITIALGLASTSLGMLVAALARSENQAGSIGMLLVFVLGGLGGCIAFGSKPVPIFRQEGLLATVSQFTPQAHALEGYLRIMMDGGGISNVLPQTGILLGMALVFFVIASRRFRFE